MDIFDGSDIQTSGWLHKDHQRRLKFNLSSDDGLLLITAAHGADNGLVSLTAPDVIPVNQFISVLGKFCFIQYTFMGKWFSEVVFQSQIFLQSKIHDQAAALPPPEYKRFLPGFVCGWSNW